MITKTSIENSNSALLSRTTPCLRSTNLSDVGLFLRKEEAISKRMRSVLEVNAALQRAIKAHEEEIGDERGSIAYLLTELLKEMSFKFQHFAEEKLERRKFKTVEGSQHTLQHMMQHYEKVEEESDVLRGIFQGLEKINASYQSHSRQLEEILLDIESSNQAHQDVMRTAIGQLLTLLASRLRDMLQINEIDRFIALCNQLREGQQIQTQKIEQLRRIASSKQEQANAISECNRKMVLRSLAEKEQSLRRMKERNNQLEVYLKELECEEAVLKPRVNQPVKISCIQTPKKNCKRKN